MQKLMGDEGWGGGLFSLLTPSVCDLIVKGQIIDSVRWVFFYDVAFVDFFSKN